MAGEVDRRNFFRPRRLLQAVTHLQQDLEQSIDEIERFAAEPVVTYRRAAMACLFEIQFPVSTIDRSTPTRAFDLIDDLEEQLSVYRENSEVSRLNRLAAMQPVPVEGGLFHLLERCNQLTLQSEGTFDITAGPLVRAWGFLRREGRMPSEGEITEALRNVGMSKVVLEPAEQSVSFVQAGVEINLGSIGKGYTLDRVVELLETSSFGPTLLSAGHSSMRALGRPPWDDAWQVDISHPTYEDRRLASIRVADGRALSTSGIAAQSFELEGKRYGHILDPRTGWPAERMLQATVVAPDAALAEALSTAFFIQGSPWAAQWCARNPDIGALLVEPAAPGKDPYVTVVGSIDCKIVSQR